MLGRRNTRDLALSTEISLAEHLRSEREFHGRIEAGMKEQNSDRQQLHTATATAIASMRSSVKADTDILHGRINGMLWKIVLAQGAVISFLAAAALLAAQHWLGK